MALEVKRYCNITTSMVHHITYSSGMIHQFLISSFYVFAQTYTVADTWAEGKHSWQAWHAGNNNLCKTRE